MSDSTAPTARLTWQAAQTIQSLRDDLQRVSEIELDMTAELAKLATLDDLLQQLAERANG